MINGRGKFGYLFIIILFSGFSSCSANKHASRLFLDLMSGYNRLIRPVQNSTDQVIVKLKLKLSQLVNIAEKNQIMTTSIWLKQVWHDTNLKWNETDYGGVKVMYIPSDQIWIPDIVLYNNADGKYQVSLMTKAAVYSNGTVVWEPPALYKSMCPIDIEFFPFDTQTCDMRFGSWTYDGYEVDLKHFDPNPKPGVYEPPHEKAGMPYLRIDQGVDLSDFYASGVFDIMEVPANRHEQNFSCCSAPYVDITYSIVLRRRTLFYMINLVIPCVGLAFLCILVFYLPSACGEKVGLSISILICLTMFFLLLVETIPSTSLKVPLIGKYLLFTMVMVTMSIAVTVVQLNFHYRSPNTHYLSPWMRKIFLDLLPKLLMMRRPAKDSDDQPIPQKAKKIPDSPKRRRKFKKFKSSSKYNSPVTASLGSNIRDYDADSTTDLASALAIIPRRNKTQESSATGYGAGTTTGPMVTTTSLRLKPEQSDQDGAVIHTAVRSACFIADYLKRQTEDDDVKEDWQFIAHVFDRLFLWIFSIGCFCGSLAILLHKKDDKNVNKAVALA